MRRANALSFLAQASLALASLALALLTLLAGCEDEPSPPPASPAEGPSSVDIVAAPAEQEPVQQVVRRELARARSEGRDLVVYVGAEWCEPCKHFHDAAAAGKLDETFPTLRLLEFDADRDGARLEAAGCASKLIPLFARPTDEGRCDAERRHMGGVKGDTAVPFLTTRLQAMLAKGPS